LGHHRALLFRRGKFVLINKVFSVSLLAADGCWLVVMVMLAFLGTQMRE
jgi:hypothetical protein